MDGELKRLRTRVRQLEGKPNEHEVSKLVGDGTNSRMNSTAFGDAVGKTEVETPTKKEAKAQAWLRKNQGEAGTGIPTLPSSND